MESFPEISESFIGSKSNDSMLTNLHLASTLIFYVWLFFSFFITPKNSLKTPLPNVKNNVVYIIATPVGKAIVATNDSVVTCPVAADKKN